MRRFRAFLATSVLLGFTATAQAAPITIDLTQNPDLLIGAVLVGTTNINSNLSISQINSIFNVSVGNLLYKSEVPSGEEGPGAAKYTTTYDNTPSDPADALIEWDGGLNWIYCGTCYLLVKDGNQSPAQYLFNISGWDGQSDISLKGFWPAQGAISNVQVFGTTIVPEPATVTSLLLGLGFIGAAARRRRPV